MPGRPRLAAGRPRPAAVRAAGAVAVLASLLLAGCEDPRAVPDGGSSAPSSSAVGPWETSPPTLSGPPAEPRAMPSAVVTLEPGATGSPEPENTPTRSDAPEESPPPAMSSPDEPETPDDEPDEPPDGSDGSDGGSELQQLEAEVVDLVNAERAGDGCPGLGVDERLVDAARAHSEDMAERNYMDHTSPEGEGPGERAREAGYSWWSGENIAMGYPTAEAVVAGWMDSSGHRANILNCESVATGVGVAESSRGLYWTQLFGRR